MNSYFNFNYSILHAVERHKVEKTQSRSRKMKRGYPPIAGGIKLQLLISRYFFGNTCHTFVTPMSHICDVCHIFVMPNIFLGKYSVTFLGHLLLQFRKKGL